jgi:fluoride ion exporter CrcB/FEX
MSQLTTNSTHQADSIHLLQNMRTIKWILCVMLNESTCLSEMLCELVKTM